MYKILKNIIEMDDYSVQKLSKSQPPEPFEWNSVEGTELNVSDCIGGKGKIAVKGNTYQKSRILPEGYTQVDYIQSHGREYIDTGINADSNLRIILDMTYDEPTGSNQNVGAINMNTSQLRYHILPQNGFFKIYIQNTAYAINTIAIDTNRHLYDIDVPNRIIQVDENKYNINNQDFDIQLNFWLFARNSDSTIYKSKNTLYKCKMYVSGVLVRDFIPCYRNSDNEVGLYDLANDVFYANDGNDAFTYGSVVDVPNPEYPQEIEVVTGDNVVKHVGKNLFDLTSITENTHTATTNLQDGTITINWTQGFNLDIDNVISNLDVAKTYTISFKHKGDALILRNRIAGVSNLLTTNTDNDYTTYSLNISNIDSFQFRFVRGSNTGIAYIKDIQIEEGSTPTSYEPYREEEYELSLGNIELCKIDDYEDIPFKNEVGDENYNSSLTDGAWYKKKIIDKKILTDLLNWSNNGTNRFSVEITAPNGDYGLSALCDRYIQASSWANHLDTDKNFIVRNGNWGENKCRISFRDSDYSSLTDWKQFVSENNLTVYHELPTPTYEQITDPTLISQLEALRKAKWYKEVNHWWTETNNLEPVLKGTYRQAINE